MVDQRWRLQIVHTQTNHTTPKECVITATIYMVGSQLETPQHARILTDQTIARKCAWTATSTSKTKRRNIILRKKISSLKQSWGSVFFLDPDPPKSNERFEKWCSSITWLWYEKKLSCVCIVASKLITDKLFRFISN